MVTIYWQLIQNFAEDHIKKMRKCRQEARLNQLPGPKLRCYKSTMQKEKWLFSEKAFGIKKQM